MLSVTRKGNTENLRKKLDAAVFRLAGIQLLEEFLSQDVPNSDPDVMADAASKVPRILKWLRKLTAPGGSPRLFSAETRVTEVFDLKKSSAARVQHDKCPICDADFPDFGDGGEGAVDPCEVSCGNGHRFPRSCLTMEPCVEMPTRRCERCLAFAGPASPWLTRSACLLCDGLLGSTC